MITQLALALLAIAPAEAAYQTLTFCVEYRLDFDDAAFGDWWTDNSNAKALGVHITVTDDWTSHDLNLSDDTGCADVTVDTTFQSSVVLRAISESDVEGIEIESYDDSYYWKERDKAVVQWAEIHGTSDGDTITRELPVGEGVWRSLAVAGWMMNRNDFNLGTGPSRACCLENTSGYDKDGTCTTGNYGTIDPPIRLYAHVNHRCGGSSVIERDTSDTDAPNVHHPALVVNDSTCDLKATLTHEISHVIVGMRQGGKEGGYPGDALLDDCMANYRDAALTNPLDWDETADTADPGDRRGTFTKEFMSKALREGWADFGTAWAWNRRTETDCVVKHSTFIDFDLDGDADNDFPDTGTYLDHSIACRGAPWLNTSGPSAIDGRNWLEDLQDTGYVNHCGRDTDADKEANRGTVYDVARMFWELTADDGYDHNPSVLADLYVDMCARGWAEDDDAALAGSSAYVEDDLPLERLHLSADHHSIDADVDAAVAGHLEH